MSRKSVKRMSAGFAVMAGAVALGVGGSTAAFAEPADDVSSCTSEQLAVSLDTPSAVPEAAGQFTVPVYFKNISNRTCGIEGLPTVSLVGPEHALGTTFQLTQGDPNSTFYALVPNETVNTAAITVLTPSTVDPATWTPTTVEVTPPGKDKPLITEWNSGLPVLRQDGATHPGSYVGGVPA
jgi:uncharacterized protein DUF4232